MMTPKERAAMQPSQQAVAAMQQALEALESCNVGNWSMAFDEFAVVEAITALREALAEQACPNGCDTSNGRCVDCPDYVAKQAEPVAAYKDAPRVIYLQTGCEDPEFCECSFNEWGDTTWCADKIHDTDIPYIREDYAASVRTKDLTDDEIFKLFYSDGKEPIDHYEFARAVIAADREKNRG